MYYFTYFHDINVVLHCGSKFISIKERIFDGEYKNIAKLVAESIDYRDNREYELITYTIMPNHVHIVFTPIVTRFAESRKNVITQINEDSDFVESAIRPAIEINPLINRY